MNLNKKKQLLQRRRWRIYKKVKGTAERPRLAVYFSHQHIYAQCIDDRKGATLVYLSSLAKDFKEKNLKPNIAGATEFGKIFAKKAKEVGIQKVVFDRGLRCYHGVVKAFANAAREIDLAF